MPDLDDEGLVLLDALYVAGQHVVREEFHAAARPRGSGSPAQTTIDALKRVLSPALPAQLLFQARLIGSTVAPEGGRRSGQSASDACCRR